MRAAWAACAVVVLGSLAGCGYNTLQRQDEEVKANWSEVLNQYQRRYELIPNLVKTVQGYASQEQKVLIGVTEARARAGSIQLTPELLNDPAAFAKFQAAQTQLSQSLKSLFAVAEAYPQLKSDANFRDLQAQLEGTENRIAVARNRYIDSVKSFNTTVRSFPTNLTARMFDFQVKPNLALPSEQEMSVPVVDFGSGTAPPAAGGSASPPSGNSPPPRQ